MHASIRDGELTEIPNARGRRRRLREDGVDSRKGAEGRQAPCGSYSRTSVALLARRNLIKTSLLESETGERLSCPLKCL